MNEKSATDWIRQLDGARIVPDSAVARPTFLFNNDESLSVENVAQRDSHLTFDLLVPTTIHDCHDYIWTSELHSGTTDKVFLVQNLMPIEGAKVIAIVREGKGYAHEVLGPERYRLTFRTPLDAMTNDPLQVHFVWTGHVFAVVG